MANWATYFHISHAALAILLKILIRSKLELQKDPRSLLATPKEADIKSIAGGYYYHFGVEGSIVSQLVTISSHSQLDNVDMLTLHIHIDGLPLHRSSNESLTPILALVKEFIPGSDPCVIGVYSGKSKPNPVHDYLHDFVQEMSHLQDQGLEYNGKKYQIKIDAFICDAPARAFLKCTKGHAGYSGCERCTDNGIYIWQAK